MKSINRREVRQRFNPTFTQTFCFWERPQESKSKTPYSRCQILDNQVTDVQTIQQKEHKRTLAKATDQVSNRSAPIAVKYLNNSTNMQKKQNELSGQLEQRGNEFFMRSSNPISRTQPQQFIPNDCKFNDNCQRTVGLQNQYCNYRKDCHDRLLKQKYDFKHVAGSMGNRLYSYRPIASNQK